METTEQLDGKTSILHRPKHSLDTLTSITWKDQARPAWIKDFACFVLLYICVGFFPLPVPPISSTRNATKILPMISSYVVYACTICNRYAFFGLIESIFYILRKPEVSSVGNKLTKTCAIYRLQTLITGLFQSPSGIPKEQFTRVPEAKREQRSMFLLYFAY